MVNVGRRLLPSVEFLRECFDYDGCTGLLRWKVRPEQHFSTEFEQVRWNKRYAGKSAGCVAGRGYFNVGIAGVRYQLHRVIWKWVIGIEPPETIDHIDSDTGNNRWANLRSATMTEQGWNVRLSKANTSGYRGVSCNHGKWQAYITIYGVQWHLGYFCTVEEAVAVRNAAARNAHGEFYREVPP